MGNAVCWHVSHRINNIRLAKTATHLYNRIVESCAFGIRNPRMKNCIFEMRKTQKYENMENADDLKILRFTTECEDI